MFRTLEQELAGKVYQRVEAYANLHGKDSAERKKYGSMAHKLPVLVRTAGLVQALTFVDSRGKEPHRQLIEDLAVVIGSDNRDSLLANSRESQLQEYIYLTRKVMMALKWFKRFAQSVLEVEPTDEGEEGG